MPREMSRTQKTNEVSRHDHAERSFDDFNIICTIGKGTCGQIYKAVDKATRMTVALRVLKLDNEGEGLCKASLREIKLVSQLKYQHIARLLEIVRDKNEDSTTSYASPTGQYFVLFEYAAHDIGAVMKAGDIELSPVHIGLIVFQLLKALAYCHLRSIVHCNVKPSSILIVPSGEVKLTNFTSARLVDSSISDAELASSSASLWYRAPELLLGTAKTASSMDMWSCGCVLGELTRRRPLFTGADDLQQIMAISIVCGSPSTAVWPEVVYLPRFYTIKTRPQYQRRLRSEFCNQPSGILDVLDGLLTLDPEKRLTAGAALENTWLHSAVLSCELTNWLPTDRDCHSSGEVQTTAASAEQGIVGKSSQRDIVNLPGQNEPASKDSSQAGGGSVQVAPGTLEAINKVLSALLTASSKQPPAQAASTVTEMDGTGVASSGYQRQYGDRCDPTASGQPAERLRPEGNQQARSTSRGGDYDWESTSGRREAPVPRSDRYHHTVRRSAEHRDEALDRGASERRAYPSSDDRHGNRSADRYRSSAEAAEPRHRSSGSTKPGSEFWNEMSAYCAKYEARLDERDDSQPHFRSQHGVRQERWSADRYGDSMVGGAAHRNPVEITDSASHHRRSGEDQWRDAQHRPRSSDYYFTDARDVIEARRLSHDDDVDHRHRRPYF